jgi:hypothetical protein
MNYPYLYSPYNVYYNYLGQAVDIAEEILFFGAFHSFSQGILSTRLYVSISVSQNI